MPGGQWVNKRPGDSESRAGAGPKAADLLEGKSVRSPSAPVLVSATGPAGRTLGLKPSPRFILGFDLLTGESLLQQNDQNKGSLEASRMVLGTALLRPLPIFPNLSSRNPECFKTFIANSQSDAL